MKPNEWTLWTDKAATTSTTATTMKIVKKEKRRREGIRGVEEDERDQLLVEPIQQPSGSTLDQELKGIGHNGSSLQKLTKFTRVQDLVAHPSRAGFRQAQPSDSLRRPTSPQLNAA